MFWQRICDCIYEVGEDGEYTGSYACIASGEPLFAKRVVYDAAGRSSVIYCG